MARLPLHLPEFQRHWDFVARKNITAGGVAFARGEAIDKALLTTRRLRQLYESRQITRCEDERV